MSFLLSGGDGQGAARSLRGEDCPALSGQPPEKGSSLHTKAATNMTGHTIAHSMTSNTANMTHKAATTATRKSIPGVVPEPDHLKTLPEDMPTQKAGILISTLMKTQLYQSKELKYYGVDVNDKQKEDDVVMTRYIWAEDASHIISEDYYETPARRSLSQMRGFYENMMANGHTNAYPATIQDMVEVRESLRLEELLYRKEKYGLESEEQEEPSTLIRTSEMTSTSTELYDTEFPQLPPAATAVHQASSVPAHTNPTVSETSISSSQTQLGTRANKRKQIEIQEDNIRKQRAVSPPPENEDKNPLKQGNSSESQALPSQQDVQNQLRRDAQDPKIFSDISSLEDMDLQYDNDKPFIPIVRKNYKKTKPRVQVQRAHSNDPSQTAAAGHAVILQPTEKGFKLSDCSQIKICKHVSQICENSGQCTKQIHLPKGAMLLALSNQVTADKFLHLQEIAGVPISVSIPGSNNQCKGFIRRISEQEPDEELITAFQEKCPVKILEIKRLTSTQGTKTNMVVTFEGTTLPTRLYMAWSTFRVQQYIPPRKQCFKCQGFSHEAAECKGAQKCLYCAGPHRHTDCPVKNQGEEPTCANCGKPHVSLHYACEARKVANKIKQTQVKQKITYKEAKNIVQPAGFSYAQALKRNTSTISTRQKTSQDVIKKRTKKPLMPPQVSRANTGNILQAAPYVNTIQEASHNSDSTVKDQQTAQLITILTMLLAFATSLTTPSAQFLAAGIGKLIHDVKFNPST